MVVLLKMQTGLSAALYTQLLGSNSVAVSTSHDFEDKVTITAFL
jgi:hypothetical protein